VAKQDLTLCSSRYGDSPTSLAGTLQLLLHFIPEPPMFVDGFEDEGIE